jgi:flagellar motor switch protein FliN
MLVEDVLRLSTDSVVELDKAAGDPVDIYVNGRLIARGEILVLNEAFCVRVSDIIEPFHNSVGANLANDAHATTIRGGARADVA